MCKVGDIIIIDSYKDNGTFINKHSFVVLDDEDGEIQGLSYDLVCNVMSSFKNKQHKDKKLRFPGNFPITSDDKVTNPDNGKEGYIKAEQLYYFKKSKIDYQVIGRMNDESLEKLVRFIENLDIDIKEIIDNL